MANESDNYGFRFKEWDIYKDAREFRIGINEFLKNYPKEEKYVLIDQTKRALNSIILNIAESANKNTDKDMRLYINRAHCSLDEVVACLDRALDDKYITDKFYRTALEKASSLAKRLNGFTNHLTFGNQLKVKSQWSIVNSRSGQSLMEIVISLTIGAILIGASVATVVPMLRSNLESKNVQIANSLAQEYIDNLQNLTESSWLNIYNPPSAKGPSSQFYLGFSAGAYQILSGSSSTIIQGLTFTRFFSIENVSRNSCGAGDITTNVITACSSGPGLAGVADDPSTQKITVVVSWPQNRSISRTEYLTRSRNKVFNQSDWSGGPNQEGPITAENSKFATSTSGDYGGYVGSLIIQGLTTTSTGIYGTTIDPVYRYAWNDVIGWLDFYDTRNIIVSATQLSGYVSSSIGYIALDCATSPNGNICLSDSNFQVLNEV